MYTKEVGHGGIECRMMSCSTAGGTKTHDYRLKSARTLRKGIAVLLCQGEGSKGKDSGTFDLLWILQVSPWWQWQMSSSPWQHSWGRFGGWGWGGVCCSEGCICTHKCLKSGVCSCFTAFASADCLYFQTSPPPVTNDSSNICPEWLERAEGGSAGRRRCIFYTCIRPAGMGAGWWNGGKTTEIFVQTM